MDMFEMEMWGVDGCHDKGDTCVDVLEKRLNDE